MPLGEEQLTKAIFPDTTIRNVDINRDGEIDGFRFNLGNPVYRGIPFSCVEDIKLVVDDEEISKEKMSFIVRGQRIRATDADTFTEIWWRQGEAISLYVEKIGGVSRKEHDIGVKLIIRYPEPYGTHDYEMRLRTPMVKTKMTASSVGYGAL